MMKRLIYQLINAWLHLNVSKSLLFIILIIGFQIPKTLISQDLLPAESVDIWADRAVYISGEKVLFSGLVNSQNSDVNLSTVVYVELITPNGHKMNQVKVWLEDQRFSGQIVIPEDILSGYYFLRAYTKWMRNGQPEDYDYILLKLINPRSDELLTVPDSLTFDFKETKTLNSLLVLDKESYQAGEPMEISWEKESQKEFKNLSISLVPDIAKSVPSTATNKSKVAGYYELHYYPETRGISLSGTINSQKEQAPLAFHLVNLHILGERDFISVLSDSAGRFHIALPERFGNHELFLIAASEENDQVEIKIDQDFCTQKVQLKVPKFSIKEEDKNQLLEMAQNQQLFQVYHQVDTTENKAINLEAFYGDAFKTIDFSFYVPLDSLHQYFTDLPSWVVVKRKKGKRKLSLLGTQGELKLYDPLVMVDWVPVDDIERIMAIDPAVVEKIDIINQTYLHGDIIYGGLINILTKRRDFGGLKFPESGMYLNYGFFSIDQPLLDTNFPFKNTYVWIPNVASDTLGNIEFKAPQAKGKYVVVLQGVDKNGDLVYSYSEFLVE